MTKKISILHKVSLIIKYKILEDTWDKKGLKAYLPKFKAMLLTMQPYLVLVMRTQ